MYFLASLGFFLSLQMDENSNQNRVDTWINLVASIFWPLYVGLLILDWFIDIRR